MLRARGTDQETIRRGARELESGEEDSTRYAEILRVARSGSRPITAPQPVHEDASYAGNHGLDDILALLAPSRQRLSIGISTRLTHLLEIALGSLLAWLWGRPHV